MKFDECLEYIESLKSYGIVPGLDNIRYLCAGLGNPQDELRFIHIAGTNGKGSVLAYLSTVLKCAGYKTGRYISPVIFGYCERIQVNGCNITHKALCEGMELIRNLCERKVEEGQPHPTPFEVETALAFWYFHKMNCDIVVLETGMGGREDATNVITRTLAAVITPVSMDHMKFLGDTLAEIGANKAGIIKNGCYVISAIQSPEAAEQIQKISDNKNCPLILADAGKARRIRYGIERQRFDYGEFKDLEISLAGKHQITNAVLAIETLAVLDKAGIEISQKAIRKGLKETAWPGRLTVIGRKPMFVVDGAHNEDAARRLAESIELYFTNKRIIYIMGVLRDKDYQKIIAYTGSYADQIITVTPPDEPRAMLAYDLACEISKVHPKVTAADSLEEAVEMCTLLAGRDDVILAFGSLSYLGRLISIVEKKKITSGKKGGVSFDR